MIWEPDPTKSRKSWVPFSAEFCTEIVSTIDNRQAGVVADRVRRNRTKKCSEEIVSLERAFGFMQKH